MKWKSDATIKQGCYQPECEKSSRLSRSLRIDNQYTSTSTIPLNPLLSLGSEERKAIKAYKLEVEKRRSMAIEYARKNTYR